MNKKLIQSYVDDRFFVSTIYRQSSAMLAYDIWYYETIAWHWDGETRSRGKIIVHPVSSHFRKAALDKHAAICRTLEARPKEHTSTGEGGDGE